MVVYESTCYRIEYLRSVSASRPYALDYKDRKGGRVCLVNLGWFETEGKAHQYKNAHNDTAILK